MANCLFIIPNHAHMINPGSLIRHFMLEHRRTVAAGLSLDFLANIAALLLPVLLGQAFASMFGFQSARGRLLGWAGTVDFPDFLSAVAGIVFLKFILDYYRKRIHGVLSERFVYHLRRLLFLHHLRMDIREYEHKGVGKYLLRFSGDMGSLQRLMSAGILQWVSDMMLLSAGLTLIAWLNPALGALTVALIGLLLAIGKQMEKLIEVTEEQRRNKKSGLLAFVSSRLLAIAALKALNRETGEVQQFDRKAGRIRQLGVQYAGQKAAFESLVASGVYGIAGSVLAAAWYMKSAGWAFSADHTFALVLIVISWRSLLGRVLAVGLVWKRGGISLRKMAQLLSKPLESGSIVQAEERELRSLSFENVSLSFGEKAVFQRLSFTLSPGQFGCITGATGAGKTLIVKLLAGLYRPGAGSILLGKFSAEDLDPRLRRRQITFVSRAFPLYGKTLLDAVANSRRTENRERAGAVFQHWQSLFPVLESIDLNTPLSENKECFSAGQLCLLECLRAHLTRKKILVLDEPFRGLDRQTAQRLAAIFSEGAEKKAILFLTANEQEVDFWTKQPDWELSLSEQSAQSSMKISNTKDCQGDTRMNLTFCQAQKNLFPGR